MTLANILKTFNNNSPNHRDLEFVEANTKYGKCLIGTSPMQLREGAAKHLEVQGLVQCFDGTSGREVELTNAGWFSLEESTAVFDEI